MMTQDPIRPHADEVKYSAADIASLNMVIWRFWVSVIAIMAAVLVLLQIVLNLIDGRPLRDSVDGIAWPFTGVMILIFAAWLLVLTVFCYWRRRKQGFHGPIHFALTEKGIDVRTRQGESLFFWSAIKTTKLRRGRIYLFINRRAALIVPRRVFGIEAEFEEFAAVAQDH